jgi:hypothetical protein
MKSIAFFFLFVATASAQQSDYSVPKFSSGGNAFPQQGNEIIRPDSGGYLTEMNVMPLLDSGEVVLRREFSSSDYRLYKGKFSPEAFNESGNLFIFQPSESLSILDAIKMKWYKEKVKNPNDDEANVYFDNKKIYVRFFSRLFYNMKDTWRTISANNIKTGSLNIMSEPGGALIFLDGKGLGLKTPNKISEVEEGEHLISLEKDGYQQGKQSVIVLAQKSNDVHITLSPLVSNNMRTIISGNPAPEPIHVELKGKRVEMYSLCGGKQCLVDNDVKRKAFGEIICKDREAAEYYKRYLRNANPFSNFLLLGIGLGVGAIGGAMNEEAVINIGSLTLATDLVLTIVKRVRAKRAIKNAIAVFNSNTNCQ